MTRITARVGGAVAVGAFVVAAVLTSGTGALASSVGHTKIGPHEFFTGLVNGRMENAIVKVVCPVSAITGRALSGQTLSVSSPLAVAKFFGRTGKKGKAVLASVGPSTSAAGPVRFTKYDDPRAFPTNIPVPCGGKGVVIFSPSPGSHGSKVSKITVTYANVAVTKVQDLTTG